MKYKYQISLLIIIIALFGFLSNMLYQEVKNETIDQANSEQLIHAMQAANSISSFFDDISYSLNVLGQDKDVQVLNERGKQKLESFFNLHKNHLKAVTYTSFEGEIKYSYPNPEISEGTDISNQTHIKKFLLYRKPVLSKVFRAVQGYNAIAYYDPFFSEKKFLGGIGALVKFDDFTRKYLQNIRIKNNGFAWIVNHQGTILYHPDENLIEENFDVLFENDRDVKNILNHAELDISGNSGHNLLFGDTTVKVQSAFFPISIADKNWTIIVSTPEKEILSTMQGFILKGLLFFLMLLLGLVLYLYFTVKAQSIIKEEKKRKKAEAELSASEKKYRQLVELSPNGILILDLAGKIQTYNKQAERLLGNGNGKGIKGSLFTDYFCEEHKNSLAENMSVIKLKPEVYTGEYNLCMNGDHYIPVEFNAVLIEDFQGEPIAVSAIIKDITERKKAEDAIILAKTNAEKSNKLKSEFLAQMSHEIRSPINSILSFTSLIKDEVENQLSSDLKTSFDIIENAGKRIIRTIDLILNMSEIQTGTYEVSLKEIDLLKDILDKVYDEFKYIAHENGLKLELINNSQKNDIHILGDEYTIGQIFNNIINNAVKYTIEGEIKIIIEKSTEGLAVFVSDTGIGISEEYQRNIFQPFTQEEQGYTRKFEGNGLGLALVKKYCDLNNIKISVESKKGIGSTFKVLFNNDVVL